VGHWQITGYEKLYILTTCVSLVAHCITHPGSRWPPSPQTTSSKTAPAKRQGKRDTWIPKLFVRNKHRLAVGQDYVWASCFDCKLGWLPSVQPINVPWSHNLFSHFTHISDLSRTVPQDLLYTHRNTIAVSHSAITQNNQQFWTEQRSLTVRPWRITSEKYKTLTILK
jgi:hypothetical protein